jgi:hypothetical protein
MNYKQIISSWMALGLILYPLSLAIHMVLIKSGVPSLILNLFGITDVPMMDYIISGMAGGFLFTYYLNGTLLASHFKIKALTTALAFEGISILAIAAFDIYTRLALLSSISEIISYGFLHGLNIVMFCIVGVLLNILCWYPFVTLGNVLAVTVLKHKNN